MKYRVVTNESFEKYISYISRSRGRGRRFEDRWDSLDFNDITANIEVPSAGEINNAVRALDIFDDAAIETGAGDVKVGSDGNLRLIDFDDDKVAVKNYPPEKSATRELDFDDNGNVKKKIKGRKWKNGEQPVDDSVDSKVRELDFNDNGEVINTKKKQSNIGAIGALDYDSDIDTSRIAATIDDVYAALASPDSMIVKSMVKRYAGDITDQDKIKKVMLAHAVQLNYDSLRVMCGDMRIVLTAKEKELGFIDRNDIKDALQRFKSIASTLTGENNTYGLIPNAIVSCDVNNQTNCINVIDFLTTWCGLPLISIYFRGAMERKCYDLASYLLDKMKDIVFSVGFLAGTRERGRENRGLLTRIKTYNDIPKELMNTIIKKTLENNGFDKLPSRVLGDLVIICIKNKSIAAIIKRIDFDTNKGYMIYNYVKDNDAAAFEVLKKRVKFDDE